MENIDLLIRNIKILMREREIENPTRLAALMEEKGLVYSQPNLSRLLSKSIKSIDVDNLIKISKFFGVTLGQIVGTEPLQNVLHLPVEDEFKRQLNMIYERLSMDNRDALTRHANLLLTAQGTLIDSATPFPVGKPNVLEKQ